MECKCDQHSLLGCSTGASTSAQQRKSGLQLSTYIATPDSMYLGCFNPYKSVCILEFHINVNLRLNYPNLGEQAKRSFHWVDQAWWHSDRVRNSRILCFLDHIVSMKPSSSPAKMDVRQVHRWMAANVCPRDGSLTERF